MRISVALPWAAVNADVCGRVNSDGTHGSRRTRLALPGTFNDYVIRFSMGNDFERTCATRAAIFLWSRMAGASRIMRLFPCRQDSSGCAWLRAGNRVGFERFPMLTGGRRNEPHNHCHGPGVLSRKLDWLGRLVYRPDPAHPMNDCFEKARGRLMTGPTRFPETA